jgi:hypothetical protein
MHRPSVKLLVIAIAACLFLTLASTAEARARLNFFHAVAGGPAVDILLRSKLNTTAHTIFSDLDYSEYTEYYDVEGGMYDVRIVAHQDHSKVLAEVENMVVITGVDFTMVVTGLLSDLEKYPLRIITFIDDNTDPDDGQAKLRFIHAAAGYSPLDVMLGGRKIFTKVSFGEHGEIVGTGYADVDSDRYTLLVTERGLSFDATTLELEDGDVLTVYAVGLRGSDTHEPTLVSQITKEGDTSAAATLTPPLWSLLPCSGGF